MIKRIYNTIIENYSDNEFLQAFSDEVESYDQEFAEALRDLNIRVLVKMMYEQGIYHPFLEIHMKHVAYEQVMPYTSILGIEVDKNYFFYEKTLKKWFLDSKKESHFEEIPEIVLKLAAVQICFCHWYNPYWTWEFNLFVDCCTWRITDPSYWDDPSDIQEGVHLPKDKDFDELVVA